MISSSKIIYNVESEFHMLRHFCGVSDKIKSKLQSSGYSNNQIENELNIPGSKFVVEFARDIDSLLKKFYQFEIKETIGLNGNLIHECKVPVNDFKNGIGTKAVIPIHEIPENERKNIYFKNNRDAELLHFRVVDFPFTNDCTIILKPTKDKYLFISGFPGSSAMPIPNTKMDLELYVNCKKFWDNHVFLESA